MTDEYWPRSGGFALVLRAAPAPLGASAPAGVAAGEAWRWREVSRSTWRVAADGSPYHVSVTRGQGHAVLGETMSGPASGKWMRMSRTLRHPRVAALECWRLTPRRMRVLPTH